MLKKEISKSRGSKIQQRGHLHIGSSITFYLPIITFQEAKISQGDSCSEDFLTSKNLWIKIYITNEQVLIKSETL